MEDNRSAIQNFTEEENCFSDSFNLDIDAKTGQTIAYVAIFFLSLVGNSLIVAVFYKERNLRTTVDFFILNMACSDFLFALTVAPRRITEILSSPLEWHVGGLLGEALCRVTYIVQDVSTAVSIESLVVIAVDRFRSIVFPLRPSFITPSVTGIIIILTWALGFGFHAPYIYTWRLYHENKIYCIYRWSPFYVEESATKTYFLVLSFFLFILPTVTLTVLYSIIVVRLQQCQNTVISYSNNLRNSWNRRNRNVLKTVIAVVVVFVFSWLPFNIFVYLNFFSWDLHPSCIARTVLTYIVILAHANNAVNPYVIFTFSTNYRDGLKALFCVRKMQNRLTEAQVFTAMDFTKLEQKPKCLPRTTHYTEKNELSDGCFNTRL